MLCGVFFVVKKTLVKMARILNKEPAVYAHEQEVFIKDLRKFHDQKG